MQVIGDSSEEKMVVAFLSAEWDSPRFGADVRYLLGDEELVRNPDLTDAAANQRRRSVLARYRGWRRNVALFEGFPRDVHWKLLEITMHDLDGFLYCNYPDWVNLSGGSRLVRDGAASAGRKPLNETKEHIRAVECEIRRGVTYPPIVAVAEGEAAVHILLEGHARASAYVRALKSRDTREVIVGNVSSLAGWRARLPHSQVPFPGFEPGQLRV